MSVETEIDWEYDWIVEMVFEDLVFGQAEWFQVKSYRLKANER